MICVLMRAVGKIAFPMSPNMFNRIEFRSITGKPVDMKSLGLLQESFNICPLVDGAIVPDQKNVSAQMTQHIPQKSDDFRTGDVMGMETDIKTQMVAARRYGDTPDGRDFITPVAVTKDRCAARRSPSFADVRYEQKTTFVQEGNMGLKFSGFFLYWAMSCASRTQWPFRLFAERVVAAFDSSSQNRGVIASIPLRGYNGRRSRHKSAVRYALMSTGRWRVLLLQLLATAFSSAFPSEDRSTVRGVPIWPGSEFLAGLSSDRSDTSALPNSGMISIFAPRSDRFCLNAAWRWLVDVALPIAWDFRVVSYTII
jgi:hypothetical protein